MGQHQSCRIRFLLLGACLRASPAYLSSPAYLCIGSLLYPPQNPPKRKQEQLVRAFGHFLLQRVAPGGRERRGGRHAIFLLTSHIMYVFENKPLCGVTASFLQGILRAATQSASAPGSCRDQSCNGTRTAAGRTWRCRSTPRSTQATVGALPCVMTGPHLLPALLFRH